MKEISTMIILYFKDFGCTTKTEREEKEKSIPDCIFPSSAGGKEGNRNSKSIFRRGRRYCYSLSHHFFAGGAKKPRGWLFGFFRIENKGASPFGENVFWPEKKWENWCRSIAAIHKRKYSLRIFLWAQINKILPAIRRRGKKYVCAETRVVDEGIFFFFSVPYAHTRTRTPITREICVQKKPSTSTTTLCALNAVCHNWDFQFCGSGEEENAPSATRMGWVSKLIKILSTWSLFSPEKRGKGGIPRKTF